MTSDAVGQTAVDLTAELLAVNSVNPGLVPEAPGERAAVDLLAERLGSAGLEVTVVEATGHTDRPSLLAVLRGSGGGRSLVLNGHLDTVGPGGMADPFAPRFEGNDRTGRLYGRGACDMKAGVAAMVACAEALASTALASTSLAGDLLLALVADEENASLGTEAVLRHLSSSGWRPDACIVGEPTWLDLVVAHRGYALVDVDLRGRPSHSSLPAEGVNAVAHLGRLLTAVEAADARLAARPPHHHAGHGSMMVTVAAGGEAPFSLAARASATVERRTIPGEDAARAVDEVSQLLDAMVAADPSVDASCATSLYRQAWQVDDDSDAAEVMALLSAGLVDAGRARPERVGAPYWMESAMWQEAGVPTVVCGPAGGGLHSDLEWVDLAQLRAYARALHHTVTAFCGRRSERSTT